MVVKNPTNNDITVQISGVKYTVPANGQIKFVPEAAALYWRDKLHGFLILEDDVVEKTEQPKAKVADVTDATEQPEEAPKTKKAK